MEEKEFDFAKEVAIEIAKDLYDDGAKPAIKPMGELIGLVPRAIKSAFLPLEKWVLNKEYNLAETKKLLEIKLHNVSPELIESPEPHIAVPALQYISYCMDNEELRDMYANLLANSMNKVVKDGVHPSFVEIIKQLSPDEARILRTIYFKIAVPTITLRYENEKGGGKNIVKDFSIIGEMSKCEKPFETQKYFDNLSRLGLIEGAEVFSSLTDKSLYEPLKSHAYIIERMKVPQSYILSGFSKPILKESYFSITSFGKSFCSICLTTAQIVVINQLEE